MARILPTLERIQKLKQHNSFWDEPSQFSKPQKKFNEMIQILQILKMKILCRYMTKKEMNTQNLYSLEKYHLLSPQIKN